MADTSVVEGSIPGYHLSELLYDGSRTLVYRGQRSCNQQPVVIKLLKNPYPSFSELVQFRNQYTIAKNLDIPGIIRPYTLEPYQNAYALVLEYLRCVQHHPQLAPAVTDFADKIDLEFLTSDLPKLINSMKAATARIQDISTSLRTFSRADTAEKVACNIHEGIDSTLLILKYRLKANEHRPAIEVIKTYGELPPIKCFLGQLNQVFMNILANAIDAIDEQSQKYSFDELKANPKKITITTEVSQAENAAVIRIKDNGPGISEAVKTKIFDHLFTTKGVGKGTGLGLAIAHQIIEQTHAGKIVCHSAPDIETEFIIELPLG